MADQVIVATDDDDIAAVAAGAGAQVHLSSAPFACGTDRVADAARELAPDVDSVINVQGDEPLVDGDVLRAALAALEGHDLGTVGVPAAPGQDITEPDAVKVWADASGRAVRFDRRHLPEIQGQPLIHVGVYAFRREALARFAGLPVCEAERHHGLEQLRAMEAGMTVGVARVAGPLWSVNRPEDVARVEELLTAS